MSDIDSHSGIDSDGLGSFRERVIHRHLYERGLKRGFDIILALVLLPVAVPLCAVLSLLIRLDGGPAFYGHARIGRSGRSFRCWKLRTMVVDADLRLATHLANDAEAALEWARDHKLRRDPRITRLGRFLRATSLDELPQILNVIKGEMSFVGPRPVTAPELGRYGQHGRFYLMCRPGLTGLWQVSGRNAVRYEDRIALDRRYAETMSFGADVALILRTVPVVLRRTGS